MITVRQFLAYFIIITFCFFTTASIVRAETNPYLIPEISQNVPRNMNTYMQSIFISFTSMISCQIIGTDITHPKTKCLGVDPLTGKIGFAKNDGGLIGSIGQMIVTLYNPPTSFGEYIAYTKSNFGIVKPTYAQTTGNGFDSIRPLLKIWLIFRNLTYMIFVIAFILVGLAIMLRIKIDPRTVMSVENQIPKLIIGLIMVTFSFPIAGLLIDTMWLGTYASINILDPNSNITNKINESPWNFFSNTLGFWTLPWSVGSNIFNITQETLGESGSGGQSCKIWNWDTFYSGKCITYVASAIGGLFVGILGFLVVLIALVFTLIRVWFTLLKAYISVLLHIVIAPFWILTGISPSGKPGFGGWLIEIISNLSVFPATIFVILLANLFSKSFGEKASTPPFSPPLIGIPNADSIGSLIAFGFILLTPTLLDKIRKAIGAIEFDTKAIAGGIGVATGLGVGSIKGTMKTLHDSKNKIGTNRVGIFRALGDRFAGISRRQY